MLTVSPGAQLMSIDDMTFLNEDIIVISLLVLWWDSYVQPRSSNSRAYSTLHKVALLETDMRNLSLQVRLLMFSHQRITFLGLVPTLCVIHHKLLCTYMWYTYGMVLDYMICVIFHFWNNFRSLLCLLITLLMVIGAYTAGSYIHYKWDVLAYE